MRRRHYLALFGAIALSAAGWVGFIHRDSGPAPGAGSSPRGTQVDRITRARQEEEEAGKAGARIEQLARIETERTQQERAAAASQQARMLLQSARNETWSTFIQTNRTVYEALREIARDAHNHTAQCTLCDGSGLMPFCILCEGSGQCPACHGTGKAYDQLCPVCLGKGRCYLCLGKGRMACPFCDDGIVYANLPPPPATFPMRGVAQSRPAELSESRKRPAAVAAPIAAPSQSPIAQGPPPIEERTETGGSIPQQILIAVAFVLTGIIALPRLCPMIGNFLNRRSDVSIRPIPMPQEVRAESQSFAEFVTAMQNGPAQNSTPTPVKETKAVPEPTQPKKVIPKPEQLREFFENAPEALSSLRDRFSEISRAQTERQRQDMMVQLSERVTAFKDRANLPELAPVWMLAGALEGLLKQLADKASNVTPSSLRTAAGAVVLLETLVRPGLKGDLTSNPPVRLLVVDDDSVSRLAVALALKKAFSQPDVASGAEAALALTATQSYDAIFLDVEMPGMDGYELCTKIHQSSRNSLTPVIFVTRHSDFDSRVKTTRSGGQDLIAKPFLSFEITVKALTFVLRGRLQAQDAVPSAESAPVTEPKPAPMSSPAVSETSAKAAATPAGPPPTERASDKEAGPVAEKEHAHLPQIQNGEFAGAFFRFAPAHLEILRNQLQALACAPQGADEQETLINFYVSTQSFASEAECMELRSIARLGSALQALLKKLIEKPERITPSNLNAAAATLDLLDELCARELDPELSNPDVRVLVVDDDPIARRAIAAAVQVAFTKPDTADGGEAALLLAAEKTFDIIFLDIEMPGMNGFTACSKIRKSALNRRTPVVFITSHSDQESRSQAALAGGSGFIPKPPLPAEITLRAVTFAISGRLDKAKRPAAVPEKMEAVVC